MTQIHLSFFSLPRDLAIRACVKACEARVFFFYTAKKLAVPLYGKETSKKLGFTRSEAFTLIVPSDWGHGQCQVIVNVSFFFYSLAGLV